MNRFDREFWEGARETALAFYDYIEGRKDVPADVHGLAEKLLRETAAKKNREFREAVGIIP